MSCPKYCVILIFIQIVGSVIDKNEYGIAGFKNFGESEEVLNELLRIGVEEYIDFSEILIALINDNYIIDRIFASSILKESLFSLEKDIEFNINDNVNDICLKQQSTDVGLWHLTRINQRDNVQINQTNYHYKYSNHDDGQNVHVYVLDTGINFNHTEFQGRAFPGYVTDEIFDDEGTEFDLHGHGTFVAALVGGVTYGVAKNVTIKSVKVMNSGGGGRLSYILGGLSYVLNDTKSRGETMTSIINMSFGTAGESEIFEVVIKLLYRNNITMITSAGNSADGSCKYIPGKYLEVINVGATNIMDVFVVTSNWGSCLDILAPGKDIRSAGIKHNNDSVIDSGTSYSAPLVTGTVARYLSYPGKHKLSNPGSVLSKLTTESTKNSIWIPENVTPNELLFVNCTTLDDGTTDPPEPKANIGLIVGGTLAVCVVIGISIFGGIAIHRKAKRIQASPR